MLAAKSNGGHPAIAATPRPAAFNAPGVVGAHGAPALGAAAPHAAMTGAAAPPVKAPGTPAPAAPHVGNAMSARPAGVLAPGARPTVTQVPPNAAVHPQAVRPQPPKPQQHPNPPKNDKRDEGRNR